MVKKKVPELKSDEEAGAFLEQDLTDYLDLGNFTQVSFEFLPKTKGISYQKYIRRAVEKALTSDG